MGLRHGVHRSTLADASEVRDWCIWSDVGALLISKARKMHDGGDLGLDLTNNFHALDGGPLLMKQIGLLDPMGRAGSYKSSASPRLSAKSAEPVGAGPASDPTLAGFCNRVSVGSPASRP